MTTLYDNSIVEAQGRVKLAVKSGFAPIPGTLVGYSAGWTNADADARIPAVYMAISTADVDGNFFACRAGVLVDLDAPFTAGDVMYLSATAGAFTATVPAISTTLTIVQSIGICSTTGRMEFDLRRTGPLYLRATAAVDPASGNTDTAQNLAVTITGVLATDHVFVSSAALAQGVIFNGANVCTADTVTVGIANASAGTVNGASVNADFLFFRQ